MMKKRFVLASRSPRRSELLKQLGFDFDTVPSRVEENRIQKETPREQVIRLAEAKALDVGSQHPDRWIIAADTVVYIDGSILGKPKNAEEAFDIFITNLGRWLRGEPLENVVDKEAGY